MKWELPLVTLAVSALIMRFIVYRNAALPWGGRSKARDRGAVRFNGESQSHIKNTAKRHIDLRQDLIKLCLVPISTVASATQNSKNEYFRKCENYFENRCYKAETM